MSEQPLSASPPPDRHGATALIAVLMLAVLALFGLVSTFRQLPCAALVGAVVLIAGPIWLFLSQRAMLARRAIIQSVGTEKGWLHRWFSAGKFTRVLLVFVALGLAVVLLAMLPSLGTTEWILLAIDAFLVGLIFKRVRTSLVNQIRDDHVDLITRLWPMSVINVVVLMAAFAGVGLFTERSVSQGSWQEVAHDSYSTADQDVKCPGAALLLGTTAALNELAWGEAVALIPGLPTKALRFVGWVLFLGVSGFGALLFTQFVLGTVAFVDQLTTRNDHRKSVGTEWSAFIATTVVVAAIYTYILGRSSPLPPPPVLTPCANLQHNSNLLRTRLSEQIERKRIQTYQQVDGRIDATLAEVFSRAEKGVDNYLDWYFSLYGDYSRLVALVAGDVDSVMLEKLTDHVFSSTNFANALTQMNLKIKEQTIHQMTSVTTQFDEQVATLVDASNCLLRTIDLAGLNDFQPDKLRVAISTISAVRTATTAARVLGPKVAATAARKAVERPSIRMASTVVQRVAKRLASAAGPILSVCALTGPFAIVCGGVATGITWVAVDMAALKIEERVRRDKMREDLVSELKAQRQILERDLKRLHRSLADNVAAEINRRADKPFLPMRDGV